MATRESETQHLWIYGTRPLEFEIREAVSTKL